MDRCIGMESTAEEKGTVGTSKGVRDLLRRFFGEPEEEEGVEEVEDKRGGVGEELFFFVEVGVPFFPVWDEGGEEGGVWGWKVGGGVEGG